MPRLGHGLHQSRAWTSSVRHLLHAEKCENKDLRCPELAAAVEQLLLRFYEVEANVNESVHFSDLTCYYTGFFLKFMTPNNKK
jgi:hypothetical protein